MHRIRFIALKEVYHILRDPRSLTIVLAMPMLMTFLYGYAINLDIENVDLAVIDLDRTAESRELINRFYDSPYFSRAASESNLEDPEAILRSGEAAAVLWIRPGYGEAVIKGEPFTLGMTVDGSDNSLGAAVQAYAAGVLQRHLRSRLPEGFNLPGVRISQQVLYNPDLKSSHFFVPGLVAIILMMISALLTSVTIAREKETGTMEQLLTAPVRPHEIIIGKLLPYIVLALTDGIIVIAFARIVFGVPFAGSELLLLGFMLIYVAAALSIGIVISSLVSTQQVAMMLALVSTMLPSVMLSGFIFALKNMPLILQGISFIIPARYFLIVIRGIMLKGAGFAELHIQAVALSIMTLLLLSVAWKRFNVRLG